MFGLVMELALAEQEVGTCRSLGSKGDSLFKSEFLASGSTCSPIRIPEPLALSVVRE
jgi:hypothetical protein